MAQRKHLGDIITRVVHDLTEKYIEGAIKHRGNLLRMSPQELKAERRKELLDHICYDYTEDYDPDKDYDDSVLQ